ncbi:MAG: glycosyltransferase family 4 protein [Vampirovibrionales bacterium]
MLDFLEPFDVIAETQHAMGGTELMKYGLLARLPAELLAPFHIIVSRCRGIDPQRIPIFWAHDCAGDPECDHLAHGGHASYRHFVFVSHWQMQCFIEHYGIPWEKCSVIENAIIPASITLAQKQFPSIPITVPYTPEVSREPIRLIYHTTPHRGLELLLPVFDALWKKYPWLVLEVFSSFKLYGWEHKDAMFASVLEGCKQHPGVRYHGAVSHEEVLQALQTAHIFAYPSIWLETSCMSLMEAMSAGCLCVHPQYGALPETSGGLTHSYPWHPHTQAHAQRFYQVLHQTLQSLHWLHPQYQTTPQGQACLQAWTLQKHAADIRFSWQKATAAWTHLLHHLL